MIDARTLTLSTPLLLTLAAALPAQDLLAVESNFQTVLRIDGTDGHVLNAVLINLHTSTGKAPKKPTHATQVGSEIWVSDAVADTVFRFDLTGQYLGEVTPGLDAPGGILPIGGEVLVANQGMGGAGYGNALVRYTPAGDFIGTYDVSSHAVPDFIYPRPSSLLVVDGAGHDLESYSYTGDYLGPLYESDGVNGIHTPAQVVPDPKSFAHDIYVAGTGSPSGIYKIHLGAESGFIDTESLGFGGVRGLNLLRNGNFLFTNQDGIHLLDTTTGAITTLYGGVVSHFLGAVEADLPDGVTLYCGPTQNPNNAAGFYVNTVDTSAPSITMTCTNGPPNQTCILIVGDNNGVVHQPPGNKGDLCIAGGSCFGRYHKDIAFIDPYGEYSIDIKNAYTDPCGGAVDLQPGATWYFQFWHRQPMGQPSAFSTAAEVTFQ